MSQRIVIFEGPDNTGKTEIAQALSKKLGIPYWKNSREHELFRKGDGSISDSVIHGVPYLADFLMATGYSAILDRSYPTEFAYSYALGRYLNFPVLDQIDKMFSQMNSIIIYCYKDYKGKYKDEFIDESLVESIKEAYETFFKMTRLKYIRLNTTDENTERQVDEILMRSSGN